MFCIIVNNNFYYVVNVRDNKILLGFNFVRDAFAYIAELYISNNYILKTSIVLIKVPVYINTIKYNPNYNFLYNELMFVELSNLWIYPNLLHNYNYHDTYGYNNIQNYESNEVIEEKFDEEVKKEELIKQIQPEVLNSIKIKNLKNKQFEKLKSENNIINDNIKKKKSSKKLYWVIFLLIIILLVSSLIGVGLYLFLLNNNSNGNTNNGNNPNNEIEKIFDNNEIDFIKKIDYVKSISYDEQIKDLEVVDKNYEDEFIVTFDTTNNLINIEVKEETLIGNYNLKFKTVEFNLEEQIKINVKEPVNIFDKDISPIRVTVNTSLEINYNKQVDELQIVSYSKLGIVNASINTNNFKVILNGLDIGETTITFSATNALKESIIVIVYNDESKEKINLDKKELTLDIIDGVRPKETISYNSKINNLKLKQSPDFLKVTIESSIIIVEALSEGFSNLEFYADNAIESEFLKVNVNEINTPIIDEVSDIELSIKDDPINKTVQIKNKIEGEKLDINNKSSNIAEVTYDDNKSVLTIKPLEIGSTNITLKYKNATNRYFKVTVVDLFDISKFEIIMDYVQGFEEKTKDQDLNDKDKELLISELFKLNGYVNNEYKKYKNDLILNNFHTIQGQKINRKFNLSSKSGSKLVKGKLVDVFFRASPLDLSDKENQIKTVGSNITDLKSNELSDKNKVSNSILQYFISLNKDLNPMNIKNVEIKKGSAVNKNSSGNAEGLYNLIIKAKDNQNDIKNETSFKFGVFWIEGKEFFVDIESLFN
ncbi:hypothetical protein [Spiroplasma turonicum]|uniref:Uncharacterized protein n=1 Tax=Spiroplasma turonicum TaxID=216946 RepID=A0A0K1P6I0_9MOLU|nr:hypothetical protein [Spiroplasma turonicum]AKU79908.1 hypothetical protein STURON_00662 [Spiroplasma turonicum]ALX70920.1 hypothetical protein STURO_v1c06610 [Spiroplasma turonicum]